MPDPVSQSEAPAYVPFALRLDQAEHVWGAVEAVIRSCREADRPVTEYAPLCAALVIMGRAIEAKRAETQQATSARSESRPGVGADPDRTPSRGPSEA